MGNPISPIKNSFQDSYIYISRNFLVDFSRFFRRFFLRSVQQICQGFFPVFLKRFLLRSSQHPFMDFSRDSMRIYFRDSHRIIFQRFQQGFHPGWLQSFFSRISLYILLNFLWISSGIFPGFRQRCFLSFIWIYLLRFLQRKLQNSAIDFFMNFFRDFFISIVMLSIKDSNRHFFVDFSRASLADYSRDCIKHFSRTIPVFSQDSCWYVTRDSYVNFSRA